MREWLAAQRIDGVMFLSGDRHFGEFLKIERAGRVSAVRVHVVTAHVASRSPGPTPPSGKTRTWFLARWSAGASSG